jgi:hypothetical protein
MSVNAAHFPNAIYDGTSVNRDNRTDNKAPDYEDWDQLVSEVVAAQTAIAAGVPATSGNGAVAGTGNTVEELLSGVHKTTITLSSFSMLVATTGVGIVGTKIYDFPAGLIRILGAVADLTITTSGGGEIDADADVIASVGSVTAADDGTLTSTEANIVPSTAYTLVAGTKHAVGLGIADAWLDGITGNAADVFLNIVVPDADRTDTNEAVTVSGTIAITWANLGDA